MPDAAVRFRRTPPPGFAPVLAAARLRAGLGLRETARQVGISAGYLADLEGGRRCPSVTIAGRLAETLAMDEEQRATMYAAAVTDAGRDHPAKTTAQVRN